MNFYLDDPGFGAPSEPDLDDRFESAPVVILSTAQQTAMAVAVDASLRERGCDNTLLAAQQWAAAAGVDWPRLRSQLEGSGSYCDCEIMFNVFPVAGPDG